MELSMNFFVTIIIAIVLLGIGITLLTRFVGITQDTQESLDERTQTRINELLTEGKQVTIPFNRQDIRRGSSEVFGLGVLNILEEGSFRAEVELSGAFYDGNTAFDDAYIQQIRDDLANGQWALYDTTATIISTQQRRLFDILIDVPKDARSGNYVFNVKVFRNNEQYENIQKIYVAVP